MIGESSTALRSVSLTGSLVSVIASGPETARTGDLQMTLSILITNLKGGCGKTTIATNLAAAFARSGFVTAIADLDRQKSSKGWTERRPDTLAPVYAMDWSQEIGSLPTGIERLILDAPAALKRKQLEEMVAAADMVMVPVVPGAFDEQATRLLSAGSMSSRLLLEARKRLRSSRIGSEHRPKPRSGSMCF